MACVIVYFIVVLQECGGAQSRHHSYSRAITAACTMKMIALTNLLLGVLTMVAGQAPGDEQELCTVTLPALNRNIVEDPPNGRILMDSSQYSRLLSPNSNPVWQAVDLDDNNPVGLQSSVSIKLVSILKQYQISLISFFSG